MPESVQLHILYIYLQQLYANHFMSHHIFYGVVFYIWIVKCLQFRFTSKVHAIQIQDFSTKIITLGKLGHSWPYSFLPYAYIESVVTNKITNVLWFLRSRLIRCADGFIFDHFGELVRKKILYMPMNGQIKETYMELLSQQRESGIRPIRQTACNI